MSRKVLGIDLGTSNSCFAIYEAGQPNVIVNAEGSKTTPSIVAFNQDGTRVVGQVAKRQMILNPKNVVHSAKRLIGKKFDQVKDLKKILAYDIVEGKSGAALVKIGDKEYTPEEISSMVLAKIKADAEAYLGEKITDAVITVPAYFGDSERQATKDAGKIAGLNVLRIINEPTAGCLAYGLDKKDSKTIVVFDIGAGTSDVSILEYGDGVFEVLATNGDSLLGGDDIDEALMRYVNSEFQKENGIDLLKDTQAKARLKEACEKAKCELSNALTTNINLPFITADANGPKHLSVDVTRAKFEQIVSSVFDKFEEKCQICIKDSGKSLDEISDVIMVGGSTRIPYIQEFAKRVFKKDVNKSINPDEAVAIGACIQGAVLSGDETVGNVVLLDVVSLSYGIETLGGVFTKMIEKGTTIPFKKTETFSTAADNQPAVSIRVFQGERAKAMDNKLIGNFDLDGIPPAPRGVPKIEVTFDIDANGILSITAKDLGTNKENHITITGSSSLTDEEIQRMVKDAELNAEADKKFKEDQDLLNKADALVFNLEKQLKDNEDKISQDLKDTVTGLIDQVKKSREAKDIEELKKLVSDLEANAMKIGEEIYKSANPNGAPNGGFEDLMNQFKNGKVNPDGSVDAEPMN